MVTYNLTTDYKILKQIYESHEVGLMFKKIFKVIGLISVAFGVFTNAMLVIFNILDQEELEMLLAGLGLVALKISPARFDDRASKLK